MASARRRLTGVARRPQLGGINVSSFRCDKHTASLPDAAAPPTLIANQPPHLQRGVSAKTAACPPRLAEQPGCLLRTLSSSYAPHPPAHILFCPPTLPPPARGSQRAVHRGAPFCWQGNAPVRVGAARALTPARGMTPRRRARTPAHRAVRRSEHVRCGCAAPPLATGATIATASGSPESLRGNRKSAEGAHLAAERLRARRSPQRHARGRSTGAHAEP